MNITANILFSASPAKASYVYDRDEGAAWQMVDALNVEVGKLSILIRKQDAVILANAIIRAVEARKADARARDAAEMNAE